MVHPYGHAISCARYGHILWNLNSLIQYQNVCINMLLTCQWNAVPCEFQFDTKNKQKSHRDSKVSLSCCCHLVPTSVNNQRPINLASRYESKDFKHWSKCQPNHRTTCDVPKTMFIFLFRLQAIMPRDHMVCLHDSNGVQIPVPGMVWQNYVPAVARPTVHMHSTSWTSETLDALHNNVTWGQRQGHCQCPQGVTAWQRSGAGWCREFSQAVCLALAVQLLRLVLASSSWARAACTTPLSRLYDMWERTLVEALSHFSYTTLEGQHVLCNRLSYRWRAHEPILGYTVFPGTQANWGPVGWQHAAQHCLVVSVMSVCKWSGKPVSKTGSATTFGWAWLLLTTELCALA